jgi:AraC-like DNA-binding protein
MADLAVMMTIPARNVGGQPPVVPNGAEPVDIWKARNFIQEHFADQLSLRSVAKAAGISPGHLSEKFRQITGVNFVDYVGRIRVEQACARLENGDARISEIAFDVGFQSLSQFNRVFKKVSGKSPTEYRAAVLARR